MTIEMERSLLIKVLPASSCSLEAFTIEGTSTAFISPPAIMLKIILGSLLAISKEFAIGEFSPKTKVSRIGERIIPSMREVKVPKNITSEDFTIEVCPLVRGGLPAAAFAEFFASLAIAVV